MIHKNLLISKEMPELYLTFENAEPPSETFKPIFFDITTFFEILVRSLQTLKVHFSGYFSLQLTAPCPTNSASCFRILPCEAGSRSPICGLISSRWLMTWLVPMDSENSCAYKKPNSCGPRPDLATVACYRIINRVNEERPVRLHLRNF